MQIFSDSVGDGVLESRELHYDVGFTTVGANCVRPQKFAQCCNIKLLLTT